MKKILLCLSMLLAFICVGCGPTLKAIPEGEYISIKEQENEYFTKAKYSIEEITKEEYELVTIKDIEFRKGTAHSYDGEYSFYINNILYEGNIEFSITKNSNNGFYIKIDSNDIYYDCAYQEEKNN